MNNRVWMLWLWSFAMNVNAQSDTIPIFNPSFDGIPHKGSMMPIPATDWFDCGNRYFPGESPPDLHGDKTPIWGVRNEAFHGTTFLGLVTRDNRTWEAVTQKLSMPLKAHSCYTLKAHLARSPKYASPTIWSKSVLINFTNPVIVRIFGGQEFCDKRFILATSAPVTQETWTEFVFSFSPPENLEYIVIEAYYDPAAPKPYNGLVLVDGLSPIVEKSCE